MSCGLPLARPGTRLRILLCAGVGHRTGGDAWTRGGTADLAAGGLGGIIGDGQLPEAGPEQILETFYSYSVFSWARVTADYQLINDPAYNRQRGPVSLFGLRLHAQF